MAPKGSKSKSNAKTARTGDLVKFDPERVKDYLDAAQHAHAQAKPIIDAIVDKLSKHGDYFKWMENSNVDALALHAKFPFPDKYAATLLKPLWQQGLSVASLWMFGVSHDDGFSEIGDDPLLAMVCLILNNTFLTDPALAGTEALSIRRIDCSNKALLTKVDCDSTKQLSDIRIASIGYIKGLAS